MEKKLPSRIKRKRNIKIKKSTVGIFVAIFAFVFAMFQAFAGENPRVTISNSNTPNSKGQYTLTVDLETNKEYSGLVLGIEYDPDELEFVRATANDIWRPYTAAEQAQIDALADEGLSPAELSAEVANLNKEFGLDWQTIVNTETPGQILLTYLFLDDRTANADNNLAKLVFKPKAGAAGKLDVTISNARMEYIGDDESIEYVVDTVDGYVQVDVPVESYELEEDTFELQKGATEQLNVVYTPENTTADKTFTYSSSDSNIVSVDDNGLMTANAVGTATITVHAFGDTLTANVTVVNHITKVNITQVNNKHSVAKDATLQLTGSVEPDDTDDSKTLTWSSSSESIATVDQTGKVTGVAAGTVTISAESVNHIVGTYEVSVVVPITRFELDENSNLTMAKGASHEVQYVIEPENPSEDTTITWESSNPEVASVSNGVVSALAGGTTVITGTLGETLNDFDPIVLNVTVNVPLISVTITEDSVSLFPEQSQTLEATLNPTDATNRTVTWSSSNPDVATVDQTGKVTAVAPGDATITARVEAEDKQDTASVHVKQPVTGATINKPTVTLTKNGTDKLDVIFTPEGAEENVTVTWSSADTSKVTVDADGTIHGVAGTTSAVKVTGKLSKEGLDDVYSMVTVNVPLENISLSETSLTLDKGNNKTLTVSYDPEDTTDPKGVTWTSADDSIATVDSNGKVTAVGKGVTTITATVGTQESGIHTANCQVTVNVPVTSVTINSDDFDLPRTETKALSATVAPSDASESTVTWSSDNTSVATVDSNGVVTAVAKGTANITATAGGKSDSVEVTVYVPATSFEAESNTMDILRKETKAIKTMILPADADDQKITWVSANPSIATVDADGKVTGVAEGTTTVTGTLANDLSVTVTVNVSIIPVESIEIDEENDLEMLRKDTTKLTVTYKPTNATEVEDVTWESSDSNVATVDATGLVTAVGEGSATITVRMGQLSDTIGVEVSIVEVEGVTLDNNKKETEVGKDFQLTPSFEPNNATETEGFTFTYESSDPEIATVDNEGNVTSKKAGKVKITIKASNGVDEYEDTIELTINVPSSPKTGVTPIWVYGAIIAILSAIGLVVYKKKELF